MCSSDLGTISVTASSGSIVTINGQPYASGALYGPGTYNLVASAANGRGSGACTASATVVISEPAALSLTASSNSPVCFGSALNLSVAGSWTSVSWSGPNGFTSSLQNPVVNNVTNLNSGVYAVTAINSNGCSASSSTTVSVISTSVTASASPAVVCSGSASILNATGATNFSWSPSTGLSATTGSSVTARPTATTIYTVTGTTGTCTGSATVTVTAFSSGSQNGLENVIVEKYYVSNAADSAGSSGILPVGSVTYRIYADLAPGFNFQALYGVPGHPIKIQSSTSFFNNEDYGAVTPTSISSTNTRKNTVMLDSWFSVGGTANGKVGLLKPEDTDGSIGNANGILQNADTSIGFPLYQRDGMIGGSPLAATFVGLSSTGNGDLGVFDGLSRVGGDFISSNGSIAALGGAIGPNAANRVLVGQFTTEGAFHYELNVQIGTPCGGTQNYVSSAPVGNEILAGFLTNTINSAPLVANCSVVQPLNCVGSSNGSVSVSVSGGSAPYTYSWTPAASLLGANTGTPSASPSVNTTYHVTITNYGGCTKYDSAVVVVAGIAPPLNLVATPQTILNYTSFL